MMFKRSSSTWPPAPPFGELTPEGRRIMAAQWVKARRDAECGHSACRDEFGMYPDGCRMGTEGH